MATVEEDESIDLLQGEVSMMVLKGAFCQIGNRMYMGTLYTTNYRVYFHMAESMIASVPVYTQNYLNIPLACIDSITKEKQQINSGRSAVASTVVVIICKDIRVLRFNLQGKSTEEYEVDKAITFMCKLAFTNSLSSAFALTHVLPIDVPTEPPYNVVHEFSVRQNIIPIEDSMFRFSTANTNYALCSSYPEILIVPKEVKDEDLFHVAGFRAGARFPVLCWGDIDSGASIWRSAQPKTGVNNTSFYDQKYLDIIARSNTKKRDANGVMREVSIPILHIVDCRPQANALANRAVGAGYEDQGNYPNSRLQFYDIGNIQVMRDSLRKLISLSLGGTPKDDVTFSKIIEESNWLTNVRYVLKCALETVAFICKGNPVLVHCSHGWDRTSQICALSQLFLDAHFRTISGFKDLVEKEFVTFGYQFSLRASHMLDKKNRQEDQMSPIFIQFLDCVWQIIKQYPHMFEFNTRFLLAIADHVYSCRFSTFLFNEPREKDNYLRSMDRETPFPDVWTYLSANRKCFINPFYNPSSNSKSTASHSENLFLPVSSSHLLRNVTIWSDYYFRWSTTPTLGPLVPNYLQGFLSSNRKCDPKGYIPVTASAGSLEEEKRGSSKAASVSGSGGSGVSRFYDWHLYPICSSDDYWEAAYRSELVKNSPLEPESTEEASTVNHDEIIANNNYVIACQQEVLDRLLVLLRQGGVSEEKIMSALTSPLTATSATNTSTDDTGICSHGENNNSSRSNSDVSLNGSRPGAAELSWVDELEINAQKHSCVNANSDCSSNNNKHKILTSADNTGDGGNSSSSSSPIGWVTENVNDINSNSNIRKDSISGSNSAGL